MPNNVVGFKINGRTYPYDHDHLANLPTIDAVPTQGSTNAVQSGGVYSALQAIELETGEVKDSVESLTEYSIINKESSSDSFHSDENIYGLKVLGNADAFTNIFLADKKNLIPQLNITTETKNGITFSGGGRFWKVSGTSTASTSKSTTPDFVSADIPAGTYIVRVYRSGSYTATDNPYFSIVGRKADNSTISIGSFYLNNNPYREWTKTISADIVSVKIMFAVPNGTTITDTLKLWLCMFPSDVTITDTSETVSDGATKTLNIDASLYPYGIDTMQHESVALYNPKIQKYIRDYVANNVPEDVLTTTEIPYVTPEMFGAIGDYSTDDTIAIQNCINYGIANNLPIKMFSRYKTTSPITVVGELIDLYIHIIENVGNGKGVIITGKRCHIVIDKIISVDDAVTLTTDASHDCSMNIIETTWIGSRTGRCIVLTTSGGNTSEFNNEIHSKFLYAPNSNCIYIDSAGVSGGETRFIGNGCLINSGSWAFYISGHKTCRFSGFSMENDAQKGVYCADYNAGGYFDDFRVTEMLDRIDSDANDPEKGLFAKGAGVQNIVISGFDIDYKSIDVSECMSFADRHATGEAQPGQIGDMRGVGANRISIKRYSDAMAYDEDGTTVFSSQCFVPPATKMLVWFEKKYVISPQDTIHDFSADTTIPNCGIVVPDTFAKIIPTIFNIVGTCVINLSDSYNPIANNRIIVLQNTHGATAQIYDSDGTLIFDGATLGDGEYEIISVVDPATILETSPKHYHLFTGHNMSWLVNKL